MASKAPKPTIRERAREAICPYCGGPVVRRSVRGPVPTFCDARGQGVCKREHGNRHIVEGRAVIALAKAWRVDRGVGEIAQESLRQMVQIIDLFNGVDLEEKRPRCDLYAAKLLADGSIYLDRKRP